MTKCVPNRADFERVYNEFVLGAGFFEIPEYYEIERERYWRSLEILCDMGLDSKETVVEFGGGQMSMLLAKMFGMDCTVADISEDYREPVDAAGLGFVVGNLTLDKPVPDATRKYDLVILLEVIEHIPTPPSVTYRRLATVLAPNGRIFITTPNVFRLRNTARMLLGRDYLDLYREAEPGVGLGHQHEYSVPHMRWQFEHAGFKVEDSRLDELGATGHSAKARLARLLLKPLTMRPAWREKLVMMGRLGGGPA